MYDQRVSDIFSFRLHLLSISFPWFWAEQSDRSRGFGFVTMSTVEEATKCIENLNGVVSSHLYCTRSRQELSELLSCLTRCLMTVTFVLITRSLKEPISLLLVSTWAIVAIVNVMVVGAAAVVVVGTNEAIVTATIVALATATTIVVTRMAVTIATGIVAGAMTAEAAAAVPSTRRAVADTLVAPALAREGAPPPVVKQRPRSGEKQDVQFLVGCEKCLKNWRLKMNRRA